MEVLNLVAGYFGGWFLPYISLALHIAYIGEYLHFKYLKCLVIKCSSLKCLAITVARSGNIAMNNVTH